MTKSKALLQELKTFKARKSHAMFIKLSYGNKKLKANKRVTFLVWNIPAVITCPHRTPNCEHFCYALKAEKQYPSCKAARYSHLYDIAQQADFVDRMIFTIQAELDRPKNSGKKVVFRIHESGDFYNMTYVNKWLKIMDYFKDNKNIVFVAYTKSVVFFDGMQLPDNLFLLASVWDDTKQSNLDIIARNNFRIYTAYSGDDMKKALENNFAFCPCKDCGSCGLCWNNYTNNICCEIH